MHYDMTLLTPDMDGMRLRGLRSRMLPAGFTPLQ